jgi:serine/threonine-protein kinase
MLTGEPPHTGASAQAILGKILLADVTRPTKLRRTIPANVEGAVLKALERLPADRFEAASELVAALKDKSFRHGMGAAAVGGPWKALSICLSVTTLLALVLAGLAVLLPEPPAPVLRQQIFPPGDGAVPQWSRYFALAPDGSSYVYRDTVGLESGWQLWVKDRDASEGRRLSGTDGARNVVFSPDGNWIAYVVGRDLMLRPVQDAPAVPLLGDMDALTTGLDWLPDGTILCEQTGQILVRIPADGSAPPDTLFDFMPDSPIWVQGLPGERAALVVTCPMGTCATRSSLNVLDLQADTAWVLLEEVVKAWYLPTGHLLWIDRDGGVFATPFDLNQLSLSGNHQPLFEGVRVSQRQWKSADMVLGEDGTIVLVEGLGEIYDYQPVWVDRHGREEVIDVGLTGDLMYPSLSPDGSQLALVRRSEEGNDIWVVHLRREVTERLTNGGGDRPVWTPDGSSVTFYSDRAGGNDIWVKRADGGGEATLLFDGDLDFAEVGWSPDGKWLILRTSRFENEPGDILAWEVGEEAAPIPVVATEFLEVQPSLSPDGRLLAYSSNRSGARQEIFVRAFLGQNGGRWQITDEGGREPLWAESGGNLELFYRRPSTGDMVAVSVNAGDSIRFGQERVLFNAEAYRANDLHPTYDVTPDGRRFLMLVRKDAGEGPPATEMHMILNWLVEFKDRVDR